MNPLPTLAVFLMATACTAASGGKNASSGADPASAVDADDGDTQPAAEEEAGGDDHVVLGDLGPSDTSGGDSTVVHLSCNLETETAVQTTSVATLHAYIAQDDLLAVVDVRESSETVTGIIAGALLYPWNSGVLSAQHASLPNDRPLFVICAGGSRSGPASTFLANNGHTCVYNVAGGMNAWKNAGYATELP